LKKPFNTILVFVATAMLTWCVWTIFAFQIVIEEKVDLDPLLPGDHVLVSRISYGFERSINSLFGKKDTCKIPPEKGELLVFHDPLEAFTANLGENICIGECHALPGDTVWLKWKSPYDTIDKKEKYYPFIVPGKNIKIELKPWNIAMLSNAIHTHENANVCYENDSIIIINGEPKHYMTFSKDYIWIGKTYKNTNYDSYTFGFIPCNLLIGKLLCTTYSKDYSKSIFSGIRTERFFTSINKLRQTHIQ